MNGQNTNSQGGQDLHSLQPGGQSTQGSSSNLQTGGGVGTGDASSSNLLNQAVGSSNLRVSVASSNGQTSTTTSSTSQMSLDQSGSSLLPVLAIFLVIAVVLGFVYKRIGGLYPAATSEVLVEENTIKPIKQKIKIKRKKSKKANHH